MSSIFGSPSKQSSTNNATSQQQSTSSASSMSNNQAYPMLSQALGGQVNNGTGASNAIAGLTGVGGDPAAQDAAFSKFRDSTGYQFGMDQGTHAITGSAAAKGLLGSGSTAKALSSFGQNYADSQYQNYTNMLQGLTNSGNQAAGVISGAGQQSQSQSNSQSTGTSNSTGNSSGTGAKQGIGGFLGALM